MTICILNICILREAVHSNLHTLQFAHFNQLKHLHMLKTVVTHNQLSQFLAFTCISIGTLIFLGTNRALFTVTAFLVCSCVCVQFSLDFSFSVLLFILPMATIFKLAPGQTSLFTFIQLIWVICAFWKSGMQASKADISVFLCSLYLIIFQIFNG